MQRLEVSGVVRHIYASLGFKGLVRGYQPLHQTRGLTSSINFLTMEQKFGTTTFWTSNSRRGGSLMEVRLRLGMLEMTLVKDKSSRTTIILFSCQ